MVTRVGLMGRDEIRVERNAINGIPHSIFPLGEAQSSGEKKKGGGENVRKQSVRKKFRAPRPST